jgi:membrane-associated phospholipid phosphatase
VALVLFVTLGVTLHGRQGPLGVDVLVDTSLAGRSAAVRHLLRIAVSLGEPASAIVAVIAIGTASLALGRPRGALLALLAPGVAAAGTEMVLQPWVGRTLRGGSSFPSGHTVTTFAIALVGVLLVLGARRPAATAARVAIASTVLLVPVGVAASLIALDFHFFTDTIGGACLSVTTVLAFALGIDTLSDHLKLALGPGAPGG